MLTYFVVVVVFLFRIMITLHLLCLNISLHHHSLNASFSFIHCFFHLEQLCLSMDPTEGVLSLFIMTSLRYIRQILSASNSRQHEEEADELGLKLAAMSCFDTHQGSKVMAKLYQISEKSDDIKQIGSNEDETILNSTNGDDNKDKKGYVLQSFMDSHPPTMLRYDNLLNLSKEENPSKYSSKCNNTRRKLLKTLKMID